MRLWFSRRVLKILVYASHNCTFEIALSGAAMLTLMLVCAFFSTQVQKYLAWAFKQDNPCKTSADGRRLRTKEKHKKNHRLLGDSFLLSNYTYLASFTPCSVP